MIRKIGAALAVAAGALAVIGVAAPANAGPGNKIIEAGEVVVWKDTGLTGQLYDFSNQQAVYPTTIGVAQTQAFGVYPNQTAIDNNTSSIGNYSTSYVRAYHDPNYLGAYLQLLPYGQSGGGLSWAYTSLGTLDDDLSSHQVAGP